MTDSDLISKDMIFTAFGIPAFLEPWLDRFFEPGDLCLIPEMADLCVNPEILEARIVSCYGNEIPAREQARRLFRRGILDREAGEYRLADFHARFEIWALFEGWKDVPEDIRQQLNDWELASYTKSKQPQINTLKQGEARDLSQIWPMYLLTREAEAVIDRVDRIWLWPCNCRAMMDSCGKDRMTCLRFDNHRGIGWEISKERAKEIIRDAAKAGLMHSGELGLSPGGGLDGAICNCCADCCYPHQLAERSDARKLWPLTRYLAAWDDTACTTCGRCTRRCPFGAFFLEPAEPGKKRRAIGYDPELCRGCGVCTAGCKASAIRMEPLDTHTCLEEITGWLG